MKNEHAETRFYLTPPHPCSYLKAQAAQTLFLDPREQVNTELYSALTHQGFRRSGAHLYRPHCELCNACTPTRIPVDEFRPRRSQRRARRRNSDVYFELRRAAFDVSTYQLYERYINNRHTDGDMYPASVDQFKSFLLCQWSQSWFLEARLGNELIAVGVLDQLQDGLSAIYTFFAPDRAERSLGVLMILEEIELCRKAGLPHLYLGYWISGAQKMRYKTDFRPVELFVDGHWQTKLV